jgi:hypothetical protein
MKMLDRILMTCGRACWLALSIMAGVIRYEYDSLFTRAIFIVFVLLYVIMEEFKEIKC